ncbi:MAG: hypothetical protein KIT84_01755 [Labilithrix sp.]|nr:hypothetical protein [Labilithrix sp.]MCW5809712.1 hypothetical protein [Labilithrix sp.]
MSKKPLRIGELLVQSGVLTEAALADVLERQKADRRRLGDLLAERNLVEPRRLAQILSYQLSCPWLSLTNVDLPKALLELVPRDLAIEHTLVPVHLREKNGTTFLYVATHDPTDEVALAAVADAVKMPVRPMVAITFEIRQALTRYYGAPAPSLTTAPIAFKPPAPPAPHQKPAPPKPPPPVPQKKPPTTASAETARIPTVLVLNAPDRFHEQCKLAARSVGATLGQGTLMDAAEKVKDVRPAAIVVTDDIYSFDRAGLNKLAIEADALLVVWSEDVDASQLQPLLEGAVRRVRRAS